MNMQLGAWSTWHDIARHIVEQLRSVVTFSHSLGTWMRRRIHARDVVSAK